MQLSSSSAINPSDRHEKVDRLSNKKRKNTGEVAILQVLTRRPMLIDPRTDTFRVDVARCSHREHYDTAPAKSQEKQTVVK